MSPDTSKLPEDPIAAKKSEAQWRQHMRDEEDERQLGFDRSRLGRHRALMKLIAAARADCERARTEGALAKVRMQLPARIAQMQRSVTAIDRWGVNSRVLGDYAALIDALSDRYPAAKLEALRGDRRAWERAQREFTEHEKTIEQWLERAEEDDEEE
ncbi:MAG TPA: hypothetical protein VGI70_01495 [Polyangiales bacterium]